MPEPLLLALLEVVAPHPTETLGGLERDDLIGRDAHRFWAIRNPQLADELRSTLPAELQKACARRLGAVLITGARERSALRRAVLLLLAGEDVDTALGGVARWYVAQGRLAPAVDDLVGSLRGNVPHPAFEAALRRKLRWRRSWWRGPAAVATMGIIATLAAIV